MAGIFSKIWHNRWIWRSLFSSIYFNLRVLPLKQAIKLPILLYKPHFRNLSGKFVINGPIKTGMITLGRNQVPLYPNAGIVIDNRGIIAFNGFCCIGNASALTVNSTGSLSIGRGVVASAAFKVAAYCDIDIADFCRFGWDCLLIDTDFHKLTLPDGKFSRGFAPISIQRNCWLGTGCLVLKGTKLPAYATVQARSILSADYTGFGQKCIIGENRDITVKANDAYRNMDNDEIDYNNP